MVLMSMVSPGRLSEATLFCRQQARIRNLDASLTIKHISRESRDSSTADGSPCLADTILRYPKRRMSGSLRRVIFTDLRCSWRLPRRVAEPATQSAKSTQPGHREMSQHSPVASTSQIRMREARLNAPRCEIPGVPEVPRLE